MKPLKGFTPYKKEDAEKYNRLRWWAGLTFGDLLDKASEITKKNRKRLENRRPDPMQVAHMGPTRGTTGLPKVVPRTHNDYLCRVEYAARALEMNHQNITLISAPIGHDLAFSMRLCKTIFTFGKIVMLDSTQAEDICKAIQLEKVTFTAWTPTFVSRLINFEGLKNYDICSLKKMYVGGGTSSPQFIREATQKLGCIYVNAYGETEGMKAQTRLNDSFVNGISVSGSLNAFTQSFKGHIRFG